MIQLQQLQPNAAVRVVPDAVVVFDSGHRFGSRALELTDKAPAGTFANERLYRYEESRIDRADMIEVFGLKPGIERLVVAPEQARLAGHPGVAVG
jgi:hypothetical protein